MLYLNQYWLSWPPSNILVTAQRNRSPLIPRGDNFMKRATIVLTQLFRHQQMSNRKQLPRRTRRARRVEFDELSNRVIGCAIEVHRELGPGLLESTYEQCFAHELKLGGITFQLQHPQPVQYKGIRIDCGYRLDIPGGKRSNHRMEECRRDPRHPRGSVIDLHEAVRRENWIADELQCYQTEGWH